MTAVPWPADFADLTPDEKRAVLIARFAARGIHLFAFEGSPYSSEVAFLNDESFRFDREGAL